MQEFEIEETPMQDCIVCTSVTAEEIYRRERREQSIAHRVFSFLVGIFYYEE